MARTRSGTATAGEKHNLEEPAASPPAKAQKKEEKTDDNLKQQTLDDSLVQSDDKKDDQSNEAQDVKEEDANEKEDTQNEAKDQEDTQSKPELSNEDTAVKPHGRNGATPSTILEKGIVYFFLRGRVGIDNPHNVSDIARTYMLLRPIPTDAALGDGSIGDGGNARLIAIPKKIFPQSGRERWIAFVEKTHASFDKLQEEFLAANDYETKTAGVRHSPAATPVGEGVYAMTTTGRESHMAYMLTLPEELGEVQQKMGLKEKGSWIVSTRNPQYPAPSNAALPEGPDYSKEILDEFRSLRWMGTLPKHLIPNAQFLLVGESSGLDKAMEPDEKDANDHDKEEPIEEMEKLEDEDTKRMEHLGKDDSEAIFADLEARAKDYPKLKTSF